MAEKLSAPSDATALDRLTQRFPIPLNEAQEEAVKTWAADDRLWTTQETVEINLRTFARTILKLEVALAASRERPSLEGDYLRGYAAALIDSIAALTYARDAGGVDDAAFDGLNTAILAVRQMRPPTSAVPPALAASRERPTPEPTTTVKENTMQPTIGRILHYRLSEQDVTAMTRRRTNGASIADRMKADPPQWPAGAQAHIGNPLSIGDTVPLVVVRVWPNEFRTDIPGVNGQAFLDGNDTLWVLSAKEGTEPGTWSWPTKS